MSERCDYALTCFHHKTNPGRRNKSGRPLWMALSSRALAILRETEAMWGGWRWMFPLVTGRDISAATVSKLCRNNGIACLLHGYRTSFRTWAAGCTSAPRAVAEAALGHVVGGVEGAYKRRFLCDRRRQLMTDWARYLAI